MARNPFKHASESEIDALLDESLSKKDSGEKFAHRDTKPSSEKPVESGPVSVVEHKEEVTEPDEVFDIAYDKNDTGTRVYYDAPNGVFYVAVADKENVDAVMGAEAARLTVSNRLSLAKKEKISQIKHNVGEVISDTKLLTIDHTLAGALQEQKNLLEHHMQELGKEVPDFDGVAGIFYEDITDPKLFYGVELRKTNQQAPKVTWERRSPGKFLLNTNVKMHKVREAIDKASAPEKKRLEKLLDQAINIRIKNPLDELANHPEYKALVEETRTAPELRAFLETFSEGTEKTVQPLMKKFYDKELHGKKERTQKPEEKKGVFEKLFGKREQVQEETSPGSTLIDIFDSTFDIREALAKLPKDEQQRITDLIEKAAKERLSLPENNLVESKNYKAFFEEAKTYPDILSFLEFVGEKPTSNDRDESIDKFLANWERTQGNRDASNKYNEIVMNLFRMDLAEDEKQFMTEIRALKTDPRYLALGNDVRLHLANAMEQMYQKTYIGKGVQTEGKTIPDEITQLHEPTLSPENTEKVESVMRFLATPDNTLIDKKTQFLNEKGLEKVQQKMVGVDPVVRVVVYDRLMRHNLIHEDDPKAKVLFSEKRVRIATPDNKVPSIYKLQYPDLTDVSKRILESTSKKADMRFYDLPVMPGEYLVIGGQDLTSGDLIDLDTTKNAAQIRADLAKSGTKTVVMEVK